MSNRFVEVTITRQTKAVSQKGFGLPLILSTEKGQAYKEYNDLAEIGIDYGASSETYNLAAKVFGQAVKPSTVAAIGILYNDVTGSPSELSTTLNELVKTNNDFFYLLSTADGDDEITELATWIGSQKKFYFYATSNPLLPAELTQENVVGLVHDFPGTYPQAAWVGAIAPLEIGSYTGTFKTLNGVLPAAYDDAEINEIHDANANTYIREGGVNITSNSRTAAGDYFDVVQGQYFIEARMAENIFAMLAQNPKVPFTYGGIALAVAEVERTLKDAADRGIIAKDENDKPLFTVVAPNLADISPADRANRLLPNIPWVATLEGAIEKIQVNGVLKL